jgi:hypothetical protein
MGTNEVNDFIGKFDWGYDLRQMKNPTLFTPFMPIHGIEMSFQH